MVFNFFKKQKIMSHPQIMRQVMHETGYCQADIARYLKLHPSAIHHWVMGTRKIKSKYWKAIMQLDTRITLEDFMRGEDDTTPNTTTD
jgi:hypothetical protein